MCLPGTIWTAIAHIITAVVGSGVLSLAWSVAQLGWIAGPIAMLSFAVITLIQASLLADCYRSPDPEHGPIRNLSYMEAVRQNLGQIISVASKLYYFCVSFLALHSSFNSKTQIMGNKVCKSTN